jgi:hypothetical protein
MDQELKQTIHRKYILVIPFLFALHYCFSATSAQDTLPDSLVRERLQIIQIMLDQGKKGANFWWNGWLVGYSVATLAQSAIVISSDNLKTRQDWTLGAITTLLGAAGQIIAPMTPGYTSDKLEEMPEGTPEENRIKLQEAEKLLEKCALREKSGRSWKMHALDGAVNVSCGFIMWFGFKRTFFEGVENIAINTAICETQIFTQPTRAIRDYNYYCQKYKPGQELSSIQPSVSWYFTLVPGGIGIKMVF